MNPITIPAGDDYYIQANMLPMDMAGLNVTQGITAPKIRLLKSADSYRVIFEDAIKRIAEREKQNILRRLKKDPEGLNAWLEDFYRDFPDFITAQIKPIFEAMSRQDEMGNFVNQYIILSKSHFKEDINLENWEQMRLNETMASTTF